MCNYLPHLSRIGIAWSEGGYHFESDLLFLFSQQMKQINQLYYAELIRIIVSSFGFITVSYLRNK